MGSSDERRSDNVERAPMQKGDRIFGTPCLVTIEHVTDTSAYGRCQTCEDRHIIDRLRYEAGDGPWRLVSPSGSSVEPSR